MKRINFLNLMCAVFFNIFGSLVHAKQCNDYLSSIPSTIPFSLLTSLQIMPLRTLSDWESLPESFKLDVLQGRMDESLKTLNIKKHALLVQDLSHLKIHYGNEPRILELISFIRRQVKLNNISTQTTVGPQNLAFEFYSFKNKIIGVNFLATQFATPSADDHPSDGHFRSIGQARDFYIPESQIFRWSVQVTFEIAQDTLFVLSPTDSNKFKLENTGKTYFK